MIFQCFVGRAEEVLPRGDLLHGARQDEGMHRIHQSLLLLSQLAFHFYIETVFQILDGVFILRRKDIYMPLNLMSPYPIKFWSKA